ncbi:hypothetical protein [Mitsuokella jalaludinii]|jgi:hypothetical protein|uniref:hypothetical protein n=1 Tax=Mitsuokella jalaludinii TaxID=187979 RepID=UPI0020574522|nr:MAG TPA: hypothetical protein [Caudoviricetes sp.]
MALKWKRRCFRCLQYLRDDGTCQNPKCVRYVDESGAEGEAEDQTDEKSAEAKMQS